MSEAGGEVRERVGVNRSLVEVQQSVANLHRYCYEHSPQGKEQWDGVRYMALVKLRGYAGDTEPIPITKKQAISAVESVKKTITGLQKSGEIDRSSQLFETLNQLGLCMSETQEVFGIKPPKKISRRDFLKLAGMTTVAAGGVWAGTKGIDFLNEMKVVPDSQIEASPQLQQNMAFLKKKYGIEIYAGLPLLDTLVMSGEQPNPSELDKAVQGIRDAAVVYPAEYFAKNGLGRFAILKDFKGHGRSLGGATVQDPGYIVLNVGEPEWEREATHHEMYHEADGKTIRRIARTARWNMIYRGEINPYNKSNQKNFVNEYATTNDLEDRAETARYLMTPALRRDLLNRNNQSNDPEERRILTEKMNFIKQDYLEWSGGKMNEQYWQDLLDGKVDENYFK